MDKEKFKVLAATILTTLAEGDAPSGVMYAALMGRCSLAEYQVVLGALESSGYLRVEPSHMVALEPSGKALADKLNALVEVPS